MVPSPLQSMAFKFYASRNLNDFEIDKKSNDNLNIFEFGGTRSDCKILVSGIFPESPVSLVTVI